MVFARRRLLGSDAIIIVAIAVHLLAGLVIVLTREADWTSPFRVLLWGVGTPGRAAALLLLSSASAMIGQWCAPIEWWTRALLLLPQFGLILATTCLAVYASLHYGAHTPLSVMVESETRLGAPILYAVAVMVRVRGH